MAQRVLVQVSGFSAAERHALNTVFRLSEERDTAYSLWTPGAPEAPRLLLLDGESSEALAELKAAEGKQVDLIWIGPGAPARSWRAFERPISWHEVVEAMDQRFAPAAVPDFDLGDDTGAADTLPPEPEEPEPRALVASADREQRLYLRARLALAGLTCVDEAEDGTQAVQLARSQSYCIALVDHAPPQVDGWAILKALRGNRAAKPFVVLTKDGCIVAERFRAWLRGADAFMCKRPDPMALQKLLDEIATRVRPEPEVEVALP